MASRREVIWSEPALADLEDILSWIALDDPRAAADLARRAVRAVSRLAQFPESGRLVPEAPGRIYRELIARPCRIIYRRERRAILIVHVLRGERLLVPGLLR